MARHRAQLTVVKKPVEVLGVVQVQIRFWNGYFTLLCNGIRSDDPFKPGVKCYRLENKVYRRHAAIRARQFMADRF
jgi:hypothetical protein